MESDRSCEQKALTNELIQGMEIARELKADLNLNLPSSVATRDSQVQNILSCYDKALLILRSNASISNPKEDVEGGLKDHPELKHNLNKRKKKRVEWMDHVHVRVKMENGVEGPKEDGYRWRKYGHKDIRGTKYPRSYYRCTFGKTKGCCATKQVQRTDEDSTIFDIIYRGRHTCCQGNDVVLPPNPKSPNMHGHGYEYDIENKEKRDNLGNEETTYPFASSSVNDPFLNSISQTQTSYFPSPSYHGDEYDAAGTNSTIFDFNFSLEAVGIDSNFPFDALFNSKI